MPGKRIRDASLQNTFFTEAVENNAELLLDWDGLVWARPILLSLVGNAWIQGSYDSTDWSDIVLEDHAYIRISTDGGEHWRILNLAACDGVPDTHPPVSIGNPSGGLVIDYATQILQLNPATTTESGSLSPGDKTRIDNIKWYQVANVGVGEILYKDAIEVGDDVTFNIKTLVAGANISLIPTANTLEIHATGGGTGGVDNIGRNIGNAGYGIVAANNSPYIDFYNIAVPVSELALQIDLDSLNSNLELSIDQTAIDHNITLNYEADEHINHSSVSIDTEEGLQGGGDITTTRTLTLAFDELALKPSLADTDVLAFYNNVDDYHYGIAYADFRVFRKDYNDTLYVPLTRRVDTTPGLYGGGDLSTDRTLYLSISSLTTVPFDTQDYIAVYDSSEPVGTGAGPHGKIQLSSLIGNLSVDITSGAGMNFPQITGTGSIVLGTPSPITETSIDEATGTTHTHSLVLDTLSFINDVTDNPTIGFYLQWDGNEWVTADPSIGASAPGAPLNSIQFNDNNTFGGNAGLLYDAATDTIYFSDTNASAGLALILGASTADPYIAVPDAAVTTLLLDNYGASQLDRILHLHSNRVAIGEFYQDPDYFAVIKDTNGVDAFAYVLKVLDNSDEEIFNIHNTGNIFAPKLSNISTDNVLYYDTDTGLISYGAAGTGGGGTITTLIADVQSGLMVNGGNTASSNTIELDQNDDKLIEAIADIGDYIGFWDVSAGVQSKTQLAALPGWTLETPTDSKIVNLGDIIRFEGVGDTSVSGSGNTVYIESQTASFPPYSHEPNAYIGSGTTLFTYDTRNGTAMAVPSAPLIDFKEKNTLVKDNFICGTNGTTFFRYFLDTQVAQSITIADGSIYEVLLVGDYVYGLSDDGKCYCFDLSDPNNLVGFEYGITNVFSDRNGGMIAVQNTDGKQYLVIVDNQGDNYIKYKPVFLDNPNPSNDPWFSRSFWTGVWSGIVTDGTKLLFLEADNQSIIYDNLQAFLDDITNVSVVFTYGLPSGHTFDGSNDRVSAEKATSPISGADAPSSYIAIIADGYSNSHLDGPGLYMGIDDSSIFTTDAAYHYITLGTIYDIHVSTEDVSGSTNVNVIAGGAGKVYFHTAFEDPKQFSTKDVVQITDVNFLHGSPLNASIEFVYYDAQNTGGGGGIDPKEPVGYNFLNLYINSIQVEESIKRLDFIEGSNITLGYDVNGKVIINASGSITTDVFSEFSIVGTGSTTDKLKLLNDLENPGVDKYYGTDAAGVKGYFSLPTVDYKFTDLTDTPIDYIGHAGKFVKVKVTEDGVEFVTSSVDIHANTHLSGGSDVIDGDKLDISWVPTTYTRILTAETTSLNELTSHLNGIDQYLGALPVGGASNLNELTDVTLSGIATNNILVYSGSFWVNSTMADAGIATVGMLANYQPLDDDLTAIAALTGSIGVLRKTAENTWTIDADAYLKGADATDVPLSSGQTEFVADNVEDALVEVKNDAATSPGTVISVHLPSAGTVQGRIDLAQSGVDYPAGWVLTIGVSDVDLNINHGLGKRVANVTVFSISGDEEQLLLDTAAHNGITTLDINNLLIQSLATVTSAIKIYINFA